MTDGARHGRAIVRWAAFSLLAAVPDIRFVSDATDTGPDGAPDGGGKTDGDASTDGSSTDAATSCTSPSPGGGATCCGDVWCIGDCSSTNCDQCATRGCLAGEFCCGKVGNVVCKTRCP
jgi:hypothetical protein